MQAYKPIAMAWPRLEKKTENKREPHLTTCCYSKTFITVPNNRMGRKGGGRSGFLKATRRAQDSDEEDEQQALPPAAEAPAPSKPESKSKDAKDAAPDAPVISAKAAAFLKDPPAAAPAPSVLKSKAAPASSADNSYDSSDEEGAPKGSETRGQMVQRHKRESKALKDKIKKMGKKAKDEAVKLETEMEQRHVAELASLDNGPKKGAADAVAVADSLYAVSLDDSKTDGGKVS